MVFNLFKQKKGMLWSIVLTMSFLITMTSIYLVLHAKFLQSGAIGEKQFFLFLTYAKAEEKQIYADELLKIRAQQSLYDLGFNGGTEQSACGTYYGFSLWTTDKKECYPNIKKEYLRSLEKKYNDPSLFFSLSQMTTDVTGGNNPSGNSQSGSVTGTSTANVNTFDLATVKTSEKSKQLFLSCSTLQNTICSLDENTDFFLNSILIFNADSLKTGLVPPSLSHEEKVKAVQEEHVKVGFFDSLTKPIVQIIGKKERLQYDWKYDYYEKSFVSFPYNVNIYPLLSDLTSFISQGYTIGEKEKYVIDASLKEIPSEFSANTLLRPDVCLKYAGQVTLGSPDTWYSSCEEPEQALYQDISEFYSDCASSADILCTCSLDLKNYKKNILFPSAVSLAEYKIKQKSLENDGYTGNFPSFFISKDGVKMDSVLSDTFILLKTGNVFSKIDETKVQKYSSCTIKNEVYKTCIIPAEVLHLARDAVKNAMNTMNVMNPPAVIRYAFTLQKSPPPPVQDVQAFDLKGDDTSIILQWKKSASVDTAKYAVYVSKQNLKGSLTQDLRDNSLNIQGNIQGTSNMPKSVERFIFSTVQSVSATDIDLTNAVCEWNADHCVYKYNVKSNLVNSINSINPLNLVNSASSFQLEQNKLYFDSSSDTFFIVLPLSLSSPSLSSSSVSSSVSPSDSFIAVTALTDNDREIAKIFEKSVVKTRPIDDLAPGKIASTHIHVDSSAADVYSFSFTDPDKNIDGSLRTAEEKLIKVTYDVYWSDCTHPIVETDSIKELTQSSPLQILKSQVSFIHPCFKIIAVDTEKNPIDGSFERKKLLE